jgi:hypothetical protein
MKTASSQHKSKPTDAFGKYTHGIISHILLVRMQLLSLLSITQYLLKFKTAI